MQERKINLTKCSVESNNVSNIDFSYAFETDLLYKIYSHLFGASHVRITSCFTGSSATGKPIGAYCDILARCEVTRVLLLMLLQVSSEECSKYCVF